MLERGKRKPSLALAFRIEDATDGAVPARAWVREKEQASR